MELHERLVAARKHAGFDTAADAATALGVPYPTYAGHENGSSGFRANRGELYARRFKVSFEWLISGNGSMLEGKTPDSTLRMSSAKVEGVPVLGRVAANTWYTADDIIDVDSAAPDAERIPSVSGYPIEWQFGLIVQGNCLNKVAQDGDRLVCLDLIKSMVTIVEGDLVIVERIKFDGQMRQRTAKRVKKTKAGFELWPESTEPEHQDPIRLDDATDGEDIRVWGKVLWVLRKP